jgi:hypothetical protein
MFEREQAEDVLIRGQRVPRAVAIDEFAKVINNMAAYLRFSKPPIPHRVADYPCSVGESQIDAGLEGHGSASHSASTECPLSLVSLVSL